MGESARIWSASRHTTCAAGSPTQLNAQLAELIGRAYARLDPTRRVAVGHDIRLTSPELTEALCGV